ncbi:hypothetical protein TW83_01690 [Paracoccus sp. S4493]|uniref:hypothetical protein n=1 Tax=Paracoccus sp. S4493 TaxID=579490 RepID=UPI0005FA6526|nr:hypothetical protein [Paracoccus sp. S4493]KJZ32747.1 hypothetical protein TW83_01690 [Paracoccus sp. S4493]
MTFPAFPRHLTPEERSAVREVAARKFADELLSDTENKTGPITDARWRTEAHSDALIKGLTLISLNWLSERMDAVEAAQASKGDA